VRCIGQSVGSEAELRPFSPEFRSRNRSPIAFDETLYHLPFVQAMSRSGALHFWADLRFPAFPQLHESLCVPAFLLVGDTATHLVALRQHFSHLPEGSLTPMVQLRVTV